MYPMSFSPIRTLPVTSEDPDTAFSVKLVQHGFAADEGTEQKKES